MSRKIVLFNSLGRKPMDFEPIEPGKIRLYTCGPTVYDYAHIGNLRTYIFEDLLRRMFEYFGFEVRHVMNVTDVGHLTSDADTGVDKMQAAAERKGMTVWEIARFYEDAFFQDADALNIMRPTVTCRATEHIQAIIEFIQKILDHGFGYVRGGNVYFSVDKFPAYGDLGLLKLDRQKAGARIEVDPNKENPFDFVLWFTESKFPHQEMKWDSPWGVGFPGWHIECSAMATKYLGERIDIHCGGIDHVTVHHTNEVAQSEAALGHRWVNYWLHGEFLILSKGKMSKSSGKFLTVSEVQRQGFSPMHYRYLTLMTHYRSQLEFSWPAMEGARNTFENLKNLYLQWVEEPVERDDRSAGEKAEEYRGEFADAIANDLNLPQSLSVLWTMARDSELGTRQKRELLIDFDRVLGLEVASWRRQELDAESAGLIQKREAARKAGNYAESDAIRDQLLQAGIAVKDTPEGTKWYFTGRPTRPSE